MAKDIKPIYTGIIEKDAESNYHCGEYLLDYRMVENSFNLGDKVAIKSVIENPSDKSFKLYPKKSSNFVLADKKKFLK